MIKQNNKGDYYVLLVSLIGFEQKMVKFISIHDRIVNGRVL